MVIFFVEYIRKHSGIWLSAKCANEANFVEPSRKCGGQFPLIPEKIKASEKRANEAKFLLIPENTGAH